MKTGDVAWVGVGAWGTRHSEWAQVVSRGGVGIGGGGCATWDEGDGGGCV